MAHNHDLVHESLDNERLRLVESVACKPASRPGHDSWLQIHIISESGVIYCDAIHIPAVKHFYVTHRLAFSIFPDSNALRL